jgi:dTDP-glucose pyrophosphorylase
MNGIIEKYTVRPEMSIKETFKKIDESGIGNIFVCAPDGVLLGSLTDGDLRRRILQAGDLQEMVEHCYNRDPIYLVEGGYVGEDVRELMLGRTIEVIPVVDRDKIIIDVLFWKDVFLEERDFYGKTDVSVVIMAGGEGKRLDPFTKILPKPLIPIGEKPMIEIVIDRFVKQGVKNFYITLNYKGDMIRVYFDSLKKGYSVKYIWEEEFLGTAGSLKALPSGVGGTFLVSNCDIVVKADYSDFIRFHENSKNILTVAGSIYHHKLPYGVIHFGKEGKIENIQEKPELDFTVNTGVYVLSRDAVKFIPEGKKFDMTDLIQELLKKNENVGVYPVSQSSYIDVGQWDGYKSHVEKMRF